MRAAVLSVIVINSLLLIRDATSSCSFGAAQKLPCFVVGTRWRGSDNNKQIPSSAKFRNSNAFQNVVNTAKSSTTVTATSTTSSGSKLYLFFRSRQEETLKQRRKEANARLPSYALEELRRKDAPIPYVFPLISTTKENYNAEDTAAQPTVTIRLLNEDDLKIIVPMCVHEFGGGGTTLEKLIQDFPWEKKPEDMRDYVFEWWDNFALPAFIYWTFRLKIVARNPQDHALIVATLTKQPDNNESYFYGKQNDEDTRIVGMVEFSKQPPEGKRNPPAFPLPLWFKELYCLQKKLPPPDGWITNLLVDPAYRGRGYSKLLMAAAEGIARTWGCTMIQLHCDANTVSGRVPQSLYKSLGYEIIEDENSPFGWMGSEFSNKIFVIEGMPLLYFRKKIVK